MSKNKREPIHIEKTGPGFDKDKFADKIAEKAGDAVVAHANKLRKARGLPPLK